MVGRRISLIFVVLTLRVLTEGVLAHGQALPTATGGISYQVGGGVSFARPDYGTDYIKGVSFFGSVDIDAGLGVAAEYNDTNIITPLDFGETSFLGGIRYSARKRSFHPYVKALAGVGTVHFSQGTYAVGSSQSYFAFAGGAGLDYRPRQHFFVRVIDVEYQDWHHFPPNGLTPFVITVGAGYHWR